MYVHSRSRTAIALMLSLIAALSAAQAVGIMPNQVSADSTSIQLTRALSSTEPLTASGTVEVNDNGQVNIQLHQATPSSTYQAIFASNSGNIQLGVLTTDHNGEGQLQPSLNSGAYVGIFELLRTGSLQFASASVTFSVGVTASASTSTSVSATVSTTSTTQTQSSTETQSETETKSTTQTASSQTVVTGNSEQVSFQVDPNLASINAGAYAKFEIHIVDNTNGQVLLVVKDLPPRSIVIFSRNTGTAGPEFHSTMTVLTSDDTPTGTYGLTVVAIVDGQEYDSQVALVVTGSSSVSTSTARSASATVSSSLGLSITLTTSQPLYQPNSTVTLQGYVTDSSGSAVPNANVVAQVEGPFGVEVSSSGSKTITTDAAGTFQDSFQLPANSAVGTYTAFASTSKAGYVSATTHTTFVVGQSTTPSVNIQMVYVGDSAGNPTTTFAPGSVVYVWVVAQNIGATFQGVLWVQIRDPNGIPVSIQIRISTMNTGETIKDGFGFTFLSQPTPGLYTVNALVSDKLISQGGTFLTSANTEFAVTD